MTLPANIDLLRHWQDEGVYIIKPRSGAPKSCDGPIYQAETIAAQAASIATELGCKSVVWDTITGSGKEMLDELIQSGVHTDGKVFRTDDGSLKLNSGGRRDYGFVQTRLRMGVRNALIRPSSGLLNYHLIMVLHEVVGYVDTGEDSRKPVMIGPDAGGPGNIGAWGADFSAIWRLYTVTDKTTGKTTRRLQLNPMTFDIGGNKIEVKARTSSGSTVLPESVEIPFDTKQCREVLEKLLAAMSIDPANPAKTGYAGITLYGAQGIGKTWLMSVLLTVLGFKPCLYIAADGFSEYLRSFCSEAKQPLVITK